MQQPIGRTPQLEGTAGLQAFAFEPGTDARDLAFDERSALDLAVDARTGLDDVSPRHFNCLH